LLADPETGNRSPPKPDEPQMVKHWSLARSLGIVLAGMAGCFGDHTEVGHK